MHVVQGEKLENFGLMISNIWQQKMWFYLTILNLEKFLKDDAPILPEGETYCLCKETCRIALQELHLQWVGQYTK